MPVLPPRVPVEPAREKDGADNPGYEDEGD
jgi:hypothetical protein